MFLFIIMVAALGWVASWYFEAGYTPIVIAVVIAFLLSLFSYFNGDKLALSLAGAHQIEKTDNPYVYNMVENLAITSGLPTPKVYLIPDSALNAFATGRDPRHSSLALTTGLVEALANEELEGVIAHELAHVKNYDIRLMMIAIVCVGAISIIADLATRQLFWGGRKSDSRNSAAPLLLIIGLIFIILSPIFARLMQLAVSRRREYLADASAALLTRYPEGLARALEKISQSQPMGKTNQATAHLYIGDPQGNEANSKKGRWLHLFSTHPPITERIARLRSMTR